MPFVKFVLSLLCALFICVGGLSGCGDDEPRTTETTASSGMGGDPVDPVVGEWQSTDTLSDGSRNLLSLVEAGGSLQMRTVLAAAGGLVALEYDIRWTSEGSVYELEATCASGCAPEVDAFSMGCAHDKAQQTFACTASQPFSSYAYLDFEPVD